MTGRWRRATVAAGLVFGLAVLIAGGRAVAASSPSANTRPGPARSGPESSMEDQPVRFHPDAAETAAGGGGHALPATPQAGGDLSRVVAALAVVVGLIFGLRWVARRMALVPNAGRPGRGVRVLSRTVLSPKQQVLLLQVGRRVVVVGDGGGAGMHPLCEITDPDEVAGLISDAQAADRAGSPAKSFASLFRRASEPFDPGTGFSDDETPALGASAQPPADIGGLLDKVRGMRQQFERT